MNSLLPLTAAALAALTLGSGGWPAVLGGNAPGGNAPGGNAPGGNAPGGNAPKSAPETSPAVGSPRDIAPRDIAPRAGQVAGRQILHIAPIRSLSVERDDRQASRLQRALGEFVASRLGNGVEIHLDRPHRIRNAPRFVLESEISRAGDSPVNSSYFWTARLYREDGRRTLVAHFGGLARGVQDLDANFRRTPGRHVEGLLGELGERVAMALDDAGFPARFERAIRTAAARPGLEPFAIHADGAGVAQGQDGVFLIPTGEPYTLSLRPRPGAGTPRIFRWEPVSPALPQNGRWVALTDSLGNDGPGDVLTRVEREHRYLILSPRERSFGPRDGSGSRETPADVRDARDVRDASQVIGASATDDERLDLIRQLESGMLIAQFVTVRASDAATPGRPLPRRETAPPGDAPLSGEPLPRRGFPW